jgi:hypothetical protein
MSVNILARISTKLTKICSDEADREGRFHRGGVSHSFSSIFDRLQTSRPQKPDEYVHVLMSVNSDSEFFSFQCDSRCGSRARDAMMDTNDESHDSRHLPERGLSSNDLPSDLERPHDNIQHQMLSVFSMCCSFDIELAFNKTFDDPSRYPLSST